MHVVKKFEKIIWPVHQLGFLLSFLFCLIVLCQTFCNYLAALRARFTVYILTRKTGRYFTLRFYIFNIKLQISRHMLRMAT
jgi:hypothetical protein